MKMIRNILKVNRQTGAVGRIILAAGVLLGFGFTALPGGEGFEVYLNNKLVIQAHGTGINDLKSLDLKNSSPGDKLSVKYFHCGRIGKDRVVTLKNASNTVIKTFRYPDTQSNTSMDVPLKDIHVSLRLFYSSTELPKERALIILNPTGKMAKR